MITRKKLRLTDPDHFQPFQRRRKMRRTTALLLTTLVAAAALTVVRADLFTQSYIQGDEVFSRSCLVVFLPACARR